MTPPDRPLTVDECRHRLRAGGRGHVAVTVGALPAVVPVRYHLRGDELWCATAVGAVTALPPVDSIVAFEADDFVEDSPEPWNVLVVGLATALPGGRVRMPTDLASGRGRERRAG